MVRDNMYDCLTRGRYADHLDRWFDHFSRDQLLIQIYEEVIENNQKAVREAYRHIGVDHTHIPESVGSAHNSVIYPKIKNKIRKYNIDWVVGKVKGTFIARWIRQRAQSRKKKKSYREKIDGGTLEYLKNYFAEQIEKLERNLNLDVGHWKKG
jgi:phage regulator Rha-like protein